MLEIRLLGQFNVTLNGKLVEIPSRPAQSLLAYLSLTPGIAHRREKLAGMMWPDSIEEDARRNLRKALWHLRKATAEQAPLRADDITITFEAGDNTWVDALVIAQKPETGQTVEALAQVAAAYGGELLPGFYDEWIIVERERLQALFEKRIKLLLERLIETRRWNEVLEWAERWIALASAPEPAYRALMAAYAGLGDLSGVSRTYQRCADTLERELGVEPSQETYKLYKQLAQAEKDQKAELERQLSSITYPVKEPAAQSAPQIIEAQLTSGQVEPLETSQPPFKGLQFFDEADAGLFFGREELTDRLLERLDIPGNGQASRNNLLAIVGASGSGKSSLARAGLASAIRKSQAAQSEQKKAWQILTLTPTAHPLERLAASLTRDSESVTAAAALMDDMRSDPRSLRLFLHKLPAPLVLIIDQMEELFTLCREEEERRAFIDNLLNACEGERCKVVLTLRADFYAHCSRFDNLRTALAASQEYIGPMSASELRRAIEEPARLSGCSFEAGLVDLILREAGSEPGALPLLSHALLETWKRKQDHTLTLAGYAEAGGVHGAITRTAESLYQQLDPAQQRITRSIFLRLTELGEGVQDTRRRAALEELAPRAEDQERVSDVLNLLAERRLVTLSEKSVEVAHEALIREWPALRSWLSEDREGLRLHRRLTEASQSWQELDCDPSELYGEARLAQALEWAETHPDELNDLERDFLAASQAQVRMEAAEKEASRQREIEAANRFAESEQRRAESEQRRAEEQAHTAQRFRWLAAALAVLLLAAVALAGNAIRLQNIAELEANARANAETLAFSRELTASALNNLDIDPQRSILLSLQALNKSYTLEGETVLREAMRENREVRTIRTLDQQGNNIVISPDGRWLAATSLDPPFSYVTEIWDTSSWEKSLTLPGILPASSWPDSNRIATVDAGKDGKDLITYWDTRTGETLSTHQGDNVFPSGPLGDFSPDWKMVAVANYNGTTTVSSLDTNENLLTLGKPDTEAGFAVAFSPDSKRLAAIENLHLGIWDIQSGRKLVSLLPDDIEFAPVAFSHDGSQVAFGNGTQIRIVDSETGQLLHLINTPSGNIQDIEYNQEGTLLATASSTGQAFIWNIDKEEPIVTLAGHNAAIIDIDFIPNANQVATSSLDGTVRIWNISAAGESDSTSIVDKTGAGYNSIAFSADGAKLAIASGSGAIEIFDAATDKALASLKREPSQTWQSSIAFSPDGSRLASTNGEIDAHVWDTASGKELMALTGHSAWIVDLAYSPNGKRLATIGYDGKAIVWDAASGLELFAVQAFTETVSTGRKLGIAFSPNGTQFATAGGSTSKVWNAATGVELYSLPPQDTFINCISFSPDGQQLAIGPGLGFGVKIYDLATAQFTAELQGHTGSISELVFSQDGKQIFTSSLDKAIKIWDASSGREQRTLDRLPAPIYGLALSLDGNRLAAISGAEARVYSLSPEDLIQSALKRLTRWFTPEECRIFLHSQTCPERPK